MRKTHNLVFLISEATQYDKDFASYVDLAGKLTSLYLEDRYPPGPLAEYSPEEVDELLRQSEQLTAIIDKATKLK